MTEESKQDPAPICRRRVRTTSVWTARGTLLLLFLLSFLLTVLPIGRAMYRAALLLPPLITAGAAPGLLALTGDSLRYTQMTIASRSGPVFLEVYTPASASPGHDARGGILIVPGVGNNRANPQLVNLTQSLARTGIMVMVMRTPALINYELSPVDSDAVVQAFHLLAHWQRVGKDRVGHRLFQRGWHTGQPGGG